MVVQSIKCSLCGALKKDKKRSLCDKCKYQRRKVSQERDVVQYLGNRLSIAKKRSKRRNLEFSITLSNLLDLWESQKGICAVTNFPMTHTEGNFDFAVSLDRIDNAQGYVEGNVRLVCSRVNVMRNDLDIEMLGFWCRAVVNNEN